MNISIILNGTDPDVKDYVTVGNFTGIQLQSGGYAFILRKQDILDNPTGQRELIDFFFTTFSEWVKTLGENPECNIEVVGLLDYDSLDYDEKLALLIFVHQYIITSPVYADYTVQLDPELYDYINDMLNASDSPIDDEEEDEIDTLEDTRAPISFSPVKKAPATHDNMNMYYSMFSDGGGEFSDFIDLKEGSELKQAELIVKKSRVFKNANKAKRSYIRHGLIIADSKDDIERDEKIIKKFLSEFLPGNTKWIKQFRKTVLQRWVRSYAISKKALGKIQKEYRRNRANSESRYQLAKTAGKTIEMTKLLLGSRSNSDWFNPFM